MSLTVRAHTGEWTAIPEDVTFVSSKIRELVSKDSSEND